ncbi:MAG TPA: DUF6789 family protein [Ktedonobacteraceae bacterium]|nr:DUF6789 family protein [Ktedonobacteraceae bacterium]
MHTIRNGILAGLCAGLVLATFNFVVNGSPGSGLPEILHWFGIAADNGTGSRFAGYVLVVILGGIFGVLFSLIQGGGYVSGARSLLTGLGLGFAWWLLLSLVLCNIAFKQSLFHTSFADVLLTLPLNLVFGVVLGTAYDLLQRRSAEARLR